MINSYYSNLTNSLAHLGCFLKTQAVTEHMQIYNQVLCTWHVCILHIWQPSYSSNCNQ